MREWHEDARLCRLLWRAKLRRLAEQRALDGLARCARDAENRNRRLLVAERRRQLGVRVVRVVVEDDHAFRAGGNAVLVLADERQIASLNETGPRRRWRRHAVLRR